jgi:hypothetical protein
MLVDVTLQNSKGGRYAIHGQLVSKDSKSITVKHLDGIHPRIITYRDTIIEYKQCNTVKGLARRALDASKTNVQA